MINDPLTDLLRPRQGSRKSKWLKTKPNKALDSFLRNFQDKEVAILEKDRESLLAFYNFPTKHWIHIRTTNPIESSFASIHHRTTRTQ